MRSCLNTYSKEEIQSLLLYVSQNIGPVQLVSKVSQGNNAPEFLLISAKLKTDSPLDLKTEQLKADNSNAEDENAVYVCVTAGLGALAAKVIPFDKNAPIKLTTLSNNQSLYSDANKQQVNDSISFENVTFENSNALCNDEDADADALNKPAPLNNSNPEDALHQNTAVSLSPMGSHSSAKTDSEHSLASADTKAAQTKIQVAGDKVKAQSKVRAQSQTSNEHETVAWGSDRTADSIDAKAVDGVSNVTSDFVNKKAVDSVNGEVANNTRSEPSDVISIVGFTDPVNADSTSSTSSASSEYSTSSAWSEISDTFAPKDNSVSVDTSVPVDASAHANAFAPTKTTVPTEVSAIYAQKQNSTPETCDSIHTLEQNLNQSTHALDKTESVKSITNSCNTAQPHSSFLSSVTRKQHQALQHTMELLKHKNDILHESLPYIGLWTDQVISQACHALPAVDNTAIFQTLLKYAGLYDVNFALLQTKAATLKPELTPEYIKAVGSANAEIDKYLQYAQQDNQLLVHKLQNSWDFKLPFFMLSAPDIYLIDAQSSVKPINFALHQYATDASDASRISSDASGVSAAQQLALSQNYSSHSLNFLPNNLTCEQTNEPSLLQSPWCLNLRNLLTATVLLFYPQLSWRLASCAANDVPFCFVTGSGTDKKLLANHICLSYFLKVQELKLNPQMPAWRNLMLIHKSIDPAQNACLEFSLMLLDLVRLADSKLSPNEHVTTFCEFWFALDRIVRINSLQRRILGKNPLTTTFLMPCMSSRKITAQQQGLLAQPNLLCAHQHFTPQQPLLENNETLLYPAPDQPSLALTLAQLIKNQGSLSFYSSLDAASSKTKTEVSKSNLDSIKSKDNEYIQAVVTALHQYAALFMHQRRALPLDKILNCLKDSPLLDSIHTKSESNANLSTEPYADLSNDLNAKSNPNLDKNTKADLNAESKADLNVSPDKIRSPEQADLHPEFAASAEEKKAHNSSEAKTIQHIDSESNNIHIDQDQPKKMVFKINSSAIIYDPADCVHTWQIASRLELPEWITLSLRRSAFEMQDSARILEQTLLYALHKLQQLQLSYASGKPQIALYDINQVMLQAIRYMQHKLDLCAQKSHLAEQSLNLSALTQSNQPKQLVTEDRELDTKQKLAYTQKILAALQQRIAEKNQNPEAGAVFNDLSNRLQTMSSKLSRLTQNLSQELSTSQNETSSAQSTQASLNQNHTAQESTPVQAVTSAQPVQSAQVIDATRIEHSTQAQVQSLSQGTDLNLDKTALPSAQVAPLTTASKQQLTTAIKPNLSADSHLVDKTNQLPESVQKHPESVKQVLDDAKQVLDEHSLDEINKTKSNAAFSLGDKAVDNMDFATPASSSQVIVAEQQSHSAQNKTTKAHQNPLLSDVPEGSDVEFQVKPLPVQKEHIPASYQLIYADQTKETPLHGELIFTLNHKPDLNDPHMKWLNRILLNLTIMARGGKHFKFGQSFKFPRPIGDFVGATLIQPQLSNKPYFIKLSEQRTIELQQLWPLTADEFDFLQKQGIYPLLLHCMGNPVTLSKHRKSMLNGELNPAQYAAMVIDDVQRHLQAVQQLKLQTEPLAPYSHMAIFLRWAIRRGLISSEFSQRYPQIVEHAFADLNASHMREYLKGLLQGRLMIWDFSPESHAFIRSYYSGGMNVPSYPSDIDNYALEYFGPQEYTNPQMCDNAYLFVPFDQKYINTVTQNIQLAFSLFMHKHKAQTEAAKTKEATPTAYFASSMDKSANPLYTQRLFNFWKNSWKRYTMAHSPSEISIDYAYHFRRSLSKKFYPVLVHINQHWPKLPDFPMINSISKQSTKYMPESQLLHAARSTLHLDLSYADLKRCLSVPNATAINQEFELCGLLFEQWLQQLPRKFALGYLGLAEDYYEEQINIIALCQNFILAQSLPVADHLAMSQASSVAQSALTTNSALKSSTNHKAAYQFSTPIKTQPLQPNLVLNDLACVYLKALLPDPLEEQVRQINQACQVLTANLQYLQQERSLISAQEYRTYVQLITSKLELCLKLKQHLEHTLHNCKDRYTMFFKYQSLEHGCPTLDDWASHMLVEQESFAGQTLYIGWILQLIKALSSYMQEQNSQYLPQIIQAAFQLCKMRHAYCNQLYAPQAELFPQLADSFKHPEHHASAACAGYLKQLKALPQSELMVLLKHKIAFDKILDSQPLLKTSLSELSEYLQQRPKNHTGNLLHNYLWQVFTSVCIQKVKLIALKFKIKPEFLALPELDLHDLKLPQKQYASSSKLFNALSFGCHAVRWQNFVSSQPQCDLNHLLLDLPQDKLIAALCHHFKLPYASKVASWDKNAALAVDSLSTVNSLSSNTSLSSTETNNAVTSLTLGVDATLDRANATMSNAIPMHKAQDLARITQIIEHYSDDKLVNTPSAQAKTTALNQYSELGGEVKLSAIPFTQWQSGSGVSDGTGIGKAECFVLSNIRKDDCVMTNEYNMKQNGVMTKSHSLSSSTHHTSKGKAELSKRSIQQLALDPATACMYYWPDDLGLPEDTILQNALTCDYMVFKPLNFGTIPLLFTNQLAEISLLPQADLALQQSQSLSVLGAAFTKTSASCAPSSKLLPMDAPYAKVSSSDAAYSAQLLKNDDEFIQVSSSLKEPPHNSPLDFSHIKKSRWLPELNKLLAKSKHNTASVNFAEYWQRYYTDLNEAIVDFKSLNSSVTEAQSTLLKCFKDISIINKQLSAWEEPQTITELLGKYPMLSLLNRPQVLKNLNLENYWSDLLSLRQIEVLQTGKNWKTDVIGDSTSSSYYEQKFEPWQTTKLGSKDVYLVDFPVTQAWHVWLFLGHGHWNKYVDELMWLMLNREWQEKYQAMITEVGEDWARWKLHTPLNLEQASLVAKQMFCACPDMLQHGTLSQWATYLTESKEWILRWN